MSYGQRLLNSFYVGINIENFLYGIELILYFKTIRILLSNRGSHKNTNLFFALFSTMMVFSITIWVASQAIFDENMWLLNSDFPGGPYAYWKTMLSVWYMTWSTVEVIILQLTTDALMIYRCWIIWDNYCVVVAPIILWLTTLAMGILLARANHAPGSDFHTTTAKFSLTYWSISVFLDTTLTCMIVFRHGRTIQDYLGRKYASLYYAVVTIVIESVLPYTLSGISFLISLGVGSPTSSGFICVYLLMMCISSQMLILRVMMGSAWDSDTFRRPGLDNQIQSWGAHLG
ncbi:hypothetical protein HD554DRAFT_2042253 [Boletus coccyginus]|nr:hypothetical protein HD554DRAFT_2042253 [Boletus coccyginus]